MLQTVPTSYDSLKTSSPAPLPTVIERLPENHNNISTNVNSNNVSTNRSTSTSNNSASLKLEEVSNDTSNLLISSDRQTQDTR